MYTLFATSTEHIDRYASTCAHSHTMRARTMRAYANARIRIALHADAFIMRHASIRIRYLGVFRVRYARICAHSHTMRAHSHRMRSHSHRMRSHRMRMRAFKGNLCVSGTVYDTYLWDITWITDDLYIYDTYLWDITWITDDLYIWHLFVGHYLNHWWFISMTFICGTLPESLMIYVYDIHLWDITWITDDLYIWHLFVGHYLNHWWIIYIYMTLICGTLPESLVIYIYDIYLWDITWITDDLYLWHLFVGYYLNHWWFIYMTLICGTLPESLMIYIYMTLICGTLPESLMIYIYDIYLWDITWITDDLYLWLLFAGHYVNHWWFIYIWHLFAGHYLNHWWFISMTLICGTLPESLMIYIYIYMTLICGTLPESLMIYVYDIHLWDITWITDDLYLWLLFAGHYVNHWWFIYIWHLFAGHYLNHWWFISMTLICGTLPESLMILIHNAIWHHQATMSSGCFALIVHRSSTRCH